MVFQESQSGFMGQTQVSIIAQMVAIVDVAYLHGDAGLKCHSWGKSILMRLMFAVLSVAGWAKYVKLFLC